MLTVEMKNGTTMTIDHERMTACVVRTDGITIEGDLLRLRDLMQDCGAGHTKQVVGSSRLNTLTPDEWHLLVDLTTNPADPVLEFVAWSRYRGNDRGRHSLIHMTKDGKKTMCGRTIPEAEEGWMGFGPSCFVDKNRHLVHECGTPQFDYDEICSRCADKRLVAFKG